MQSSYMTLPDAGPLVADVAASGRRSADARVPPRSTGRPTGRPTGLGGTGRRAGGEVVL